MFSFYNKNILWNSDHLNHNEGDTREFFALFLSFYEIQ